MDARHPCQVEDGPFGGARVVLHRSAVLAAPRDDGRWFARAGAAHRRVRALGDDHVAAALAVDDIRWHCGNPGP